MDESKIKQIDLIIKLFSTISDSKSFSRNIFMEEAIDKFMSDSKIFLQEEYDINVDLLLEEAELKKYDTIIFASSGNRFEETFLGKNENPCWYPCKVSPDREKNLKYIAIYRGATISAITHFALVKYFKYDVEKVFNICIFECIAKELPHKIKLGNRESCYFVGTKYTSLENLLNAKQTDELIFR